MSLDPLSQPYNTTDPTASFLSSSCLDFLLIELVPLAYRVTHDLDGVTAKTDAASGNALAATPNDASASDRPVSSAAAAPRTSDQKEIDDEEELDAVHHRLETLGYRVGQGLVERYG